MREIKFRLWDKTEKEMIYLDKVGDRQHHTFGIRKDGSLDYYNLQNGSGGDEYILMQYTGLYDKNGKEIYKGDVLKCTSTLKQWKRELFDEVIGEVTAEIGMTYLVGKCKHGYLDEELKTSNYKALLLSPDLFEVIGDAHSNPELLEGRSND